MDFLNNLNESQRVAVEHVDGPMMVIAGAGSGKTRVLTYRIAYLIEYGIDSFNIMALTFTNKAAKEMKSRISTIVGNTEALNITMGTFHSVFARILRSNSDRLGYPSNFTIYDSQDSKSLIKTITKEFGLDPKVYKSGIIQARISNAKNNLISPAAYEANAEIIANDRISRMPEIFRIYKEYNNRCFKAGAMDFDDLLFQTNVLLKKYPDVLLYYQQKFKYILVDEYQDTNYSQYLIIKSLAALYENICVVGDDAQSIYSFRGANIENILNFRKDYPDYRLFKLEQNYRSTSNIVKAANSIIQRNKGQIEKEVWTANPPGNKINVIRCLTDGEEGRVITNRIFDIKHREGCDYKGFAILYRTNAQSRSFEESFRKLNMPYRIYGGLSFYQRKEIKDLIAYFRLAANPKDEEALKRVINYPKRGIGSTTMDTILLASKQYDVSVWDIITDFTRYPVTLSAGSKSKIVKFVQLIQRFILQLENTPAYDLANDIAQSSGILKNLYDDKSPEGVSRYENIQELLAGIKGFTVEQEKKGEVGSLSDFLIEVALLTDADKEENETTDFVTLMTIHAAKGLEFPHVFVVGLEENLFPSQLSLNSRSELEEERRLFYVAITRAEKTCTLSYVSSRYRYGQLNTAEPSRFISEVDQAFLNHETELMQKGGRSLTGYKRPIETRSPNFGMLGGDTRNLTPLTNTTSKSENNGISMDNLTIGKTVNHSRFGNGKVLDINGEGANKKVIVFFPKAGRKTLILKFAKLTIVE